jgi:outer membrane translocation and assembly module TamA
MTGFVRFGRWPAGSDTWARRTARLHTRLGAVLTLAVAVPLPSIATAQEDIGTGGVHGARVASLRFSGVAAVDQERLRATVVTRESECRSPLLVLVCALSDARWAEHTAFLDTAAVRRDEQRISALYAEWGYPEARVAAQVTPRDARSVDVRFHVEEGEPIIVRSVRILGMDELPEPIRIPELPLRPGVPFAVPRIEAARARIGEALARHGYAFARVEASGEAAAEEGAVDVVLEVRPGPLAVFGPTRILAEPPLSEAAVRRRLAYRDGDRFSPAALEHTVERLQRLPAVERVFVDPVPLFPGDSVLVTSIGVSAARLQGLGFGGAISSTSCLEGTVSWAHRHLFGAPRVLRLQAGAANLLARQLRRFPCTGYEEGGDFAELGYRLRSELREPIGPDTWLLLSGQFSRESFPPAFMREGVEARIGVSHWLTREVEAIGVYAPERRDNPASGPIHCALYGVCDPVGVADLTEGIRLAPLELGVTWMPPSARRPPLGPPPEPAWQFPPAADWFFTVRGGISAASGWTGSEFSFARATAEASVRRLLRRAELAARLRGGALFGAGDPLPPQVRLYGGGPLGVRGVAGHLLGPKLLTIAPEAAPPECPPGAEPCPLPLVDPGQVRVRPTGGDRLVEASLEARFWAAQSVQLAAFVDYGWVRSGAPPDAPAALVPSESIITPGIGALILSPFGPVRVDLAYNPSPPRQYPLLVREDPPLGHRPAGPVTYDPFRFGEPGALRELWRRVQLHLSLGQPF